MTVERIGWFRWNLITAALLLLGFASGAHAQTAIRVNASNANYTDTSGNVWLANTGMTSGPSYYDWGTTVQGQITNTANPYLHRFERYGGTVAYAFTVPNGSYQVRLFFSENATEFGVGARKFHIALEGTTVFSNVDVYAEAGAHLKAHIKTANVTVSDGQVNVLLTQTAANAAMISALEITSLSGGGVPSAPQSLSASAASASQINLTWAAPATNAGSVTGYVIERCTTSSCTYAQAGTTGSGAASFSNTGLAASTSYTYRVYATSATGNSPVSGTTSATTQSGGSGTAIRVNGSNANYTDTSGNVWSANTGMTAGPSYYDWGAAVQAQITNTANPYLHRFERYGGTIAYAFTVPNGSYQVRLFFSENATEFGVGARKFHIALEGTQVFSNVDVYAEAGAHRKAHIKTANVTVSDGQINVLLTQTAVNAAMISALEITSLSGGGGVPSAPQNLSASAASASQINLSWAAPATNASSVTGYVVERCTTSSCTYAQAGTTGSGTVSFSNTGLAASTSYTYRVYATSASGNSAVSGTASATTQSSGSGTAIRVNASNANYTDTSGNVWLANTGMTAGPSYYDWGAAVQAQITNTANPYLHRFERYGGTIAYAFTVPNGSYQVRLLFSENATNFGVGARKFHIALEGTTVFSNVDVYAEAGAHLKAHIKTANVTVSDGQINVLLTQTAANAAMLSALEITSLSGGGGVPSAPQSLSASAASASQINLTWAAPATNAGSVTGYVVERCTTSSCTYAQAGTTGSGTVSFSNTGLAASTSYNYRVYATSASGNSAVSGTASATTQSGGSAPAAPTALSVVSVTSSAINLSWSAPTGTPAATSYRVERCTGAACTAFAEIAAPTSTTYNNTGLSASTTYLYRVRAVSATGGLSVYSNVVSQATTSGADTTPPSAPASLSATPISSTQINLSWTASTDNAGGSGVAGYRLERCTGVSCTTFAEIAALATTTYNNIGLSNGTTYRYRVRAVDVAGNFGAYNAVIASATTIYGNETINYVYDALGRLIFISHSGTVNNNVQTGYELDPAGNRTNHTTIGP